MFQWVLSVELWRSTHTAMWSTFNSGPRFPSSHTMCLYISFQGPQRRQVPAILDQVLRYSMSVHINPMLLGCDIIYFSLIKIGVSGFLNFLKFLPTYKEFVSRAMADLDFNMSLNCDHYVQRVDTWQLGSQQWWKWLCLSLRTASRHVKAREPTVMEMVVPLITYSESTRES
jgi:hypothetical protein